MSFAIRAENAASNQYMTLNSTASIPASTPFEINILQASDPAQDTRPFGTLGSQTSRAFIGPGSTPLIFLTDSSGNIFSTTITNTIDKSVQNLFTFTRDSGNLVRFFVNGVREGPATSVPGSFDITVLFTSNATGQSRGYSETQYISIDVNGTPTHNWSADDSDRSNTGQQPVLTNTISANHATGVNMPTDGSAWINLGGGGTDQPVTVPTVQQLNESVLQFITSEMAVLPGITEQPVQAVTVNVSGNQSVTSVVTEQVSVVANVNVTTDQTVLTVVTETETSSPAVDLTVNQAVVTPDVEQLTQAEPVNIGQNTGVFIELDTTEQLSQAEPVSITINQGVVAPDVEQLSQALSVAITSGLIVALNDAEQLTEAEIINIIVSNAGDVLNIDIDNVTIEMLTPSYTIEMLTPSYTIEHLY